MLLSQKRAVVSVVAILLTIGSVTALALTRDNSTGQSAIVPPRPTAEIASTPQQPTTTPPTAKPTTPSTVNEAPQATTDLKTTPTQAASPKATMPASTSTKKATATAPILPGTWKPIYDGPIQVQAVTLTNLGYDASYGNYTWRYEYTLKGGKQTTLKVELEHEVIEGTPTYSNYGLQWVPLNNYVVEEGGFALVYDTLKGERGIPSESWGSYRVRIHVTAPNEIYSNWMVID